MRDPRKSNFTTLWFGDLREKMVTIIEMKKLIIANWKMHPLREREAIALAKAEDEENVVIAPPFPFLAAVRKKLKKAALGAQDLFWENPEDGGAFTGEVSAKMLRNIGATYVIIGHSERRKIMNESDEIVNRKVCVAITAGMEPILCVGEPKEIRERGEGTSLGFIKDQLSSALKGIECEGRQLIIAYEPLWAIGSGASDTPEDIEKMGGAIRVIMREIASCETRVLYGGSVDEENARSIFTRSQIDGVLVGGASVHESEFLKIVDAAHECS